MSKQRFLATRNKDGAAQQLDELLTYRDLATLTGESITTHRRRKMLGTGPAFLLIGGRHIRFRKSDVNAWLDSCLNGQQAR
jgi:predicted DNA-binding transcriptional regulator AlpA